MALLLKLSTHEAWMRVHVRLLGELSSVAGWASTAPGWASTAPRWGSSAPGWASSASGWASSDLRWVSSAQGCEPGEHWWLHTEPRLFQGVLCGTEVSLHSCAWVSHAAQWAPRTLWWTTTAEWATGYPWFQGDLQSLTLSFSECFQSSRAPPNSTRTKGEP